MTYNKKTVTLTVQYTPDSGDISKAVKTQSLFLQIIILFIINTNDTELAASV